jgi:hypothetical protein
LFLSACAHAPAGGLAFGVLGDTPYSASEIERLDTLIDDINAEKLDFVVHVGDIGSSKNACNDAWLEARKQQFARIRHKLVVIPGDNEWTDCKDQMGRLASWRRLFCDVPIEVERQPGEYCEHIRWEASGLLFVALNVPGSNNNVRVAAEHARRMAAVLAWLDESAALAQKRKLSLVVLMQANPFITLPRDGYGPLRERLRMLGDKMPERIVLVHGDTHTYHDDEPLPGMRRLEVWGSPIVSWVRAGIEADQLRFSAPRYR